MRWVAVAVTCACSSSSPRPTPPAQAPTSDAGEAPHDAGADAAVALPVTVVTATDPKTIDGYARVPRGQDGRASGPITSLTAAPPRDNRIEWTMVVDDPRDTQRFRIELPDRIAFPAGIGESVDVHARTTGGGPNARGQILVRDAKGGVLIALDHVPDDWALTPGKKLRTEPASGYDSMTYEVKITAPGSKPVVVGGEHWRAIKLGGATYYGSGSIVARQLHGKRMAPPDYVGGWTDVSLVRVTP